MVWLHAARCMRLVLLGIPAEGRPGGTSGEYSIMVIVDRQLHGRPWRSVAGYVNTYSLVVLLVI
jgi:hypothetical protein